MKVDWSHLSMKAYEYFLVCNLCGAMVHDSPTSKHQHVVFHFRVDAPSGVLDSDKIDGVMAAWFAERAIIAAERRIRPYADDS